MVSHTWQAKHNWRKHLNDQRLGLRVQLGQAPFIVGLDLNCTHVWKTSQHGRYKPGLDNLPLMLFELLNASIDASECCNTLQLMVNRTTWNNCCPCLLPQIVRIEQLQGRVAFCTLFSELVKHKIRNNMKQHIEVVSLTLFWSSEVISSHFNKLHKGRNGIVQGTVSSHPRCLLHQRHQQQENLKC